MNDEKFVDFDCMYAAEKEPLLKGHPGNACRRASLDRIRDGLRSKGGEDHSRLLEFVGCMEPDSALGAWEKLYRRLEEADPRLASLAALEYRRARTDAWKAMRTGADMIPHLKPICAGFDKKRRTALGEMQTELFGSLISTSGSLRLGPDMQAYIANLARFGSGADDEMTLLLVNELYVRRGLYGDACAICEKILGFEGADRQRMAGSIMVEATVESILGHIAECGTVGRAGETVRRCRRMLERRCADLGLDCWPVPGLSEFTAAHVLAHDIARRFKARTADEINRWLLHRHPAAHAFLGLSFGELEEMVGNRSLLARHVSIAMGHGRSEVMEWLEALLRGAERNGIGLGVSAKWKKEMRAHAYQSMLLEMRLYAHLSLVWRGVGVDPPIESGMADFVVDGCYLEAYAPRGRVWPEARFLGDAQSEFGLHRAMLAKPQLDNFGERRHILVAECPDVSFGNACLRAGLRDRMRRRPCLGGVLLVRYGKDRFFTEFVPNEHTEREVSPVTVLMVRGALESSLA